MKPPCSIEGCGVPQYAKGWCNKHWARARRHNGDPHKVIRRVMPRCKVSGCDRGGRTCKGFCPSHYNRWVRYGDPNGGGPRRGEPMRFLRDAIARETDACIPWPYKLGKHGHGYVTHDGITTTAHRVALALFEGIEPPRDLHCAHEPVICHNPSCINVRHLRWATPTENNADKLLDGTHQLGERNHMAKLTAADVLAIRASRDTQRALAARYGVGQDHISRIQAGISWAHLKSATA